MHYHAHIYWSSTEQRDRALSLRKSLSDLGCNLGTVWDEPIGPHPLPMYQINYSSANATEVEQLLSDKGLDILLHEDTGNDVRDHTEGARWIGTPLVLDIKWLEYHSKRI